jgi:hypothetical protein
MGGIQSSRLTKIGQIVKKTGQAPEGIGAGTLAKIADELNLSLNWLILGIGPERLAPENPRRTTGPELLDIVDEGKEQKGEHRGAAYEGERPSRPSRKR